MRKRNKLPKQFSVTETHSIRNKLPTQNNVEIDRVGLPNLLIKIRGEPLNHVLSVKVQESLGKFVEAHGGADFVRGALIEKLEHLTDTTRPGKCSECVNLTGRDGPFCVWLCASFLDYDKKHMNETWHCDGFTAKRKVKK